jgi:hypothetical protein
VEYGEALEFRWEVLAKRSDVDAVSLIIAHKDVSHEATL